MSNSPTALSAPPTRPARATAHARRLAALADSAVPGWRHTPTGRQARTVLGPRRCWLWVECWVVSPAGRSHLYWLRAQDGSFAGAYPSDLGL